MRGAFPGKSQSRTRPPANHVTPICRKAITDRQNKPAERRMCALPSPLAGEVFLWVDKGAADAVYWG